MTDIEHIWNPETGITDFAFSVEELASTELPHIRNVWTDQRQRLKGSKQLSEFTERLGREWAIETGVIENLYELERGVTQTLIERGFQAELISHGSTNRPREYVLQLLKDQKEALEGVFAFVKEERPLSVSYIKELHAALLRSQHTTEAIDSQGQHVDVPLIKGAWKQTENRPQRDGKTFAYCPPEQVASEMDRLVEMHAAHIKDGVPAEVEAAWLHHRFTQIHPFQDGNGRVARALASLVLVKAGLFPLVVTRDDKPAYLDALEAADSGSLKPLVDLFAKLQRSQFTKATAISEQVLSEETGIEELLGGLFDAADKSAKDRDAALRTVFDRAHDLEKDALDRFEVITPSIKNALLRLDNDAAVYTLGSGPETDHYFKGQIIQNARDHLGYFADTSDYRSWVSLNMKWTRHARLVFTFHGIGRPFSGSLICAPFFEFRDKNEDDETTSTFIPLTDEGFVFFHNETKEKVLARFAPWRDRVIKVALKELIDSL